MPNTRLLHKSIDSSRKYPNPLIDTVLTSLNHQPHPTPPDFPFSNTHVYVGFMCAFENWSLTDETSELSTTASVADGNYYFFGTFLCLLPFGQFQTLHTQLSSLQLLAAHNSAGSIWWRLSSRRERRN